MCTQLFDVKQDYVFKKIFGSERHPNILISLLNACFKGREKIVEVLIKNSKIEKEFVEDSYSRMDILATTDKGELINIEMQRRDEKNMVKRSLYYWAKAYSGQYNGKQQYEKIPRTVCINILEYELSELKKEENYHNVFFLKNQNNNILSDTIEIQFIELPKLVIDKNDPLSLWMGFVEDANSVEIVQAEKQIEEIHEAREELARLSRDPEQAELYRQRADAIAEKYNALLGAKEKGREEEKIKIARNLLSLNVDIEIISKSSGLSVEEIKELIEN
jgi:predicted transposase/invertase (TIGR01784 family)